MSWLQLRINTSPDNAPTLENSLLAVGALSVTFEDNADQPIFEPELGETPLWKNTRVTGLFDANQDTNALLINIEKSLGQKLEQYHWHILEDKDWEREWMQHYHPIQCAEAFWICPSWIDPPDQQAINLMLDPGLAFGTGTHPTTYLCIQWLAQQDMKDKSVIDYGCGSGILGIASLLLGAECVLGTDIDPQALIATKENMRRNKLPLEKFPIYFPNKCPSTPVDIVVANILAGPLVELATKLINLTKPSGMICLSGILKSQESKIVERYEQDVDIIAIEEKEEWICIIGRKR